MITKKRSTFDRIIAKITRAGFAISHGWRTARWRHPKSRLIILDDSFPWPHSGFRYQEYKNYLESFPDAVILCDAKNSSFAWQQRLSLFAKTESKLSSRVYAFDERLTFPWGQAYCSFLWLTYRFLPWFEERKIPFAFQLYPGGGFALDDAESDNMLRRIISSPMMRGVITTQSITTKYLKEKFGVGAGTVIEIYGVPYQPILTYDQINERRIAGRKKKGYQVTVGFAGNRYMSGGLDKGFDIFCAVAAHMRSLTNIVFQCVGDFSEQDVPVVFKESVIDFKGRMDPADLECWLCDVDILLSPVRSNCLTLGAFDGFPTTVGVMAGTCGCVIVTSDPSNLNQGRFCSGADLILTESDAQSFIHATRNLLEDYETILKISTKARSSFSREFSFNYQMADRTAAINLFFDVKTV